MVTTRLEFDHFARPDLQAALYWSHFHHAVFHAHRMDLALGRSIGSGAAQSLRHWAVIGYSEIRSGGTCALRRGARPRISNVDWTDVIFAGPRSGAQKEHHADGRYDGKSGTDGTAIVLVHALNHRRLRNRPKVSLNPQVFFNAIRTGTSSTGTWPNRKAMEIGQNAAG